MPMTEDAFRERSKVFLFAIAWVVCLFYFINSVENTRDFLAAAVTAPGRVVALNAGSSHPEIEFVTRKGERVSYPQGGWIGGYRVGDKVTVLYLENSPNPQATIDRTGAIWDFSIMLIFMLIGIPAIFLWSIFYESTSKKDKSKWKISG